MHYILNETNQIIAADEKLLELCGVSHIDQLSLSIALGEIKFDLTDENMTLTHNSSDTTFLMTKTSLSSMLGHLTLVEIRVQKEILKEKESPLLTLDDTPIETNSLDIDISSPEIEEPIRLEKETIEDDNALFDLLLEDDVKEEIATEETKEPAEEALELFAEDKETFKTEATEQTDTPEQTEASPTDEILIDIETISQKIGISHEDYDAFLDEYIDTALALEGDLQSSESMKRANATATLSNLGEVLQLPVIGSILKEIDMVQESEVKGRVESFYSALSRLTTSQTSPSISEPELDLFDAGVEVTKNTPEAPVAETPVNENSFGTISLEGIKPIHFDFQLEEAANDLSLPVELIEEFVHDFIDQAHIETKKMLESYEEGDLDAIQKIGHLLKGASSNLRINPLSDTLYEIQFCEDPSKLEAFIKEYWGHFLSFEIQINALAK